MEIMQHVLKIQLISLLPKYTKQISSSVLPCAFTYMNVGHLKGKSTMWPTYVLAILPAQVCLRQNNMYSRHYLQGQMPGKIHHFSDFKRIRHTWLSARSW
jgi:hypothetical protein